MSQSYEKDCIFCEKKIRMSDESGKWTPYNQDGSIHDCKNKGNGNVKKEKEQVTYSLQDVRKKLESIGIIINVERLMSR